MTTKTQDDVLMDNLQKAKDSGDKEAIREAIIEALRPEARLVVDLAKKDITTKDGYGAVMRACSPLAQYKYLMLEACVREGFPADTARTVKELI